jgi:hypothetical protein
MEPEGSLPCSQEPATCPYPEPNESNVNQIWDIKLCVDLCSSFISHWTWNACEKQNNNLELLELRF